MVKKINISPEFSIKGYNFWVALKNNKEFVKTIASLLSGATIFGFTIEGALVGIVTKFVLDLADYFVNKVDLE